ncbi:WSD1 family O-acyltransferase [Sansalvadorimonas sp. 2012CJ34-2]|uniref:WSD1 family O-acyltransferase n=1 Tax=Parendozoicomonas callyspongiae TaxID=2942213 RepID=A0ABT0PK76_9GAMM|nr:WS/DGAT domain-containing protein [Sansalvadorimonas sp. 2012CJ34-2]MCL6271733.1 WSD1 family O-acyltransferase [Sansalvadorimonas sp. 2012CJ34-2]
MSYDSVGLCHVVFSYNDTLTVSITCCRNMMPDPEFYAHCLRKSWQELQLEVLPDKSVKPKGKKAAAPKKKQAEEA